MKLRRNIEAKLYNFSFLSRYGEIFLMFVLVFEE
ncbi:hypothetical protein ThesiDRAFT1_1800 [Thermoanaerobacter siderophilus SR4]|uniref:Uncharacterized protein n=1 Tax=Thermoanaerobacter siderophilus SR4 TaxID=880478 RepID=I9KUW9_9THEO|nr:hypothetical protein ThesiDRAFT1_1800 [Thermoanaerobacter siderophilus SR4]